MTTKQEIRLGRGYFGIGIHEVKYDENVGVLWRGAYQLGAAFIFVIGSRYKPQRTDVYKTWQHIPLFHYDNLDQMIAAAAYDCQFVGIEMGGAPLPEFQHPHRALYLLGAEDQGLPNRVLAHCQHVVSIPAVRAATYNVAQAGTLVMYDRVIKTGRMR